MAYPIRFFEPNQVYFFTTRCFQSRLLLRPSSLTNELIAGALARATRLYGIQLHAFVFTSNHFHLLASADAGWRLVRFMQFLQSNIARKVGRLIDWRGRFFERRYSAEPVADAAALEERMIYILSHGVKEGLVATVEDWPGLSCVELLREDRAKPCVWRDWTRRWHVHREEDRDIDHFGAECPIQVEHLSLTPLPHWSAFSAAARRSSVEAIISAANGTRTLNPLGRAAILNQDPHSSPRSTKRTRRPKCHASTIALWKLFVARYRRVRAEFRQASAQWRAGDFQTAFPANVFRPWFFVFGESCET